MTEHTRGAVTVTVQDFEAARRTSGPMAKIGHDSAPMIAVGTALADYWDKPSETTRFALQLALQTWKAEKPSEFKSRDGLGKGVCSRLYNECVTPDLARGTDGIILHGSDNPQASKRTMARVTISDNSAMGLMTQLLARRESVGIIVIDIYGDTLHSMGLDKSYGGGSTVEANIQDLLKSTLRAQVRYNYVTPVLNFTMASHQTIDSIAQVLPLYTRHFNKPSNSIFEQTDVAAYMVSMNCANWVVVGFDANFCVAASIFGAPSNELLRMEVRHHPVMGARQMPVFKWTRGLLDRGYNVITSRRLLGSTGDALSPGDGWPWLGPTNR